MTLSIDRVPHILTWPRFGIPVLGNGVDVGALQIDAVGMVAAPPPVDRARVYDEVQALAMKAEMRQAIQAIAAVSPAASDLLQRVLRVILLREGDAWGSSSSSSWPGRAGLIAIVFDSGSELSRPAVMDALVHESIHSLLYGIEQSEPFYLSAEASRACTVRSPWTGRELFLHSYLHACFVWFGLLSFWRIAAAGPYAAEAPSFVQRARRGFAPAMLTDLGEAASLIRKEVREAVEMIEQLVLDDSAGQRGVDLMQAMTS